MRTSHFAALLLVAGTLVGTEGCSTSASHVLKKYLWSERTFLCYGHGEQGEFFYLQATDRENPRFRELFIKMFPLLLSGEGDLSGALHSWMLHNSKTKVLAYSGPPQEVSQVLDEQGRSLEEWRYEHFVLTFREDRLLEVRAKGHFPGQEYVWTERHIDK